MAMLVLVGLAEPARAQPLAVEPPPAAAPSAPRLADPPAAGATFGAGPAHDRAIATSFRLGVENVELPGGERMGLLGGTLWFNAAPGWWIGPATYGAASGDRGGLFVLGVDVQRRWSLLGGQAFVGLFGGGGGGAAAPVGGGLMWRPALGWLYDFGPVQAGLSYSAVRFPSGDISSRQFGLALTWDGSFRFADPARAGASGSDPGRSGLGFERLIGTVGTYRLRTDPERRIGLVGARVDRSWTDAPSAGPFGTGARWGLEAAAAASGDAAGYMEILGHAGWEAALDEAGLLRTHVRGALGLGGGGAVPTGGGVIAKLAVGATVQLSPGITTGLELGWLRAPDTGLDAPTAHWLLSFALEPPPGAGGMRQGTLARTEWTLAVQHETGAARRDGSEASLDTIGLKIARYFGPHLYASAQWHAAAAGGAGAYGVGLVGAGVATAAGARDWRAGAELLVGAAGGGGVATGGGAAVQALAWLGWSLPADSELRIGAGALRSRSGTLSTPVVELSITRAFGQLAP